MRSDAGPDLACEVQFPGVIVAHEQRLEVRCIRFESAHDELLAPVELDLEPGFAAPPRFVPRLSQFRDGPFEPQFAQGGFDLCGGSRKRIRSKNRRPFHRRHQHRAAIVERQLRQIASIEMQEVERIKDDGLRGLMMKRLERRMAALVDCDQFSIEERAVRVDAGRGARD
jgi:hypothetical protein